MAQDNTFLPKASDKDEEPTLSPPKRLSRLTFETLPKSTLSVIFSFLDNREYLNEISLINKNFRAFTNSHLYWSNIKAEAKEMRKFFKVLDLANSIEAIKCYGVDFKTDEQFDKLMEYIRVSLDLRQIKLKYGYYCDGRIEKLAAILRNQSSIRSLSLECGAQTEESMKVLFEAVINNGIMTKLKVGYNPDSAKDQALTLLAGWITKSNCQLHKLGFESNPGITANGFGAFCSSLRTNRSLREINFNLSCHKIGPNIGELAKGINENKFLRTLRYGSNSICDAGAITLAGGLAKNESLINLNLRDNKIGKDGGIALARAIKSHPTLKSVVLSYNEISAEAMEEFAEMLTYNRSLEKVYLDENPIKVKGCVYLLTRVGSFGKQLKILDLSFIKIDTDGLQNIFEELPEGRSQSGPPILDINLRGNETSIPLKKDLRRLDLDFSLIV